MPKDDSLSFNITNQGEKISSNEISKIFDNFYRINNLRTRDNSGSGLGLAIVRKIAEIHGAKISFTSQVGFNSVEVLFKKIS